MKIDFTMYMKDGNILPLTVERNDFLRFLEAWRSTEQNLTIRFCKGTTNFVLGLVKSEVLYFVPSE